MQVAVISGVTGQTGSYLAEILLKKGYFVIGFSRRVSVDTSDRIKHLLTNPNFQFEEGDICDAHYITSLLTKYRVSEFYNLAAQSHVATSFKQPVVTSKINYEGVLNILNCIKELSPTTKFYQASTSEMFGSNYDTYQSIAYTEHGIGSVEKYQDENTKMMPQSPYAVAKLGAHHLVRLYRESYGIYAAAGIMKITKYIGELFQFCEKDVKNLYSTDTDEVYCSQREAAGAFVLPDIDRHMPKLRLGNLDASRDWGHSRDTANGIYNILQQEKPDDFVLCTGETHTIREFLTVAFNHVGITNWEPFVVIDPEFYRPAEVDYLRGCCKKAQKAFGWKPSYSFQDLVKEMVEYEL
jgi:GDPmannose 4,6-dehydratase